MAAERPATRRVYRADREGESRAWRDRAAELEPPAEGLIRCLHHRTLAEGGELEQAPVRGQVQVTRPRDGARQARPGVPTLRLARFELPSPGGKALQVTARLAREEQPPERRGGAVEWRWLTNECLATTIFFIWRRLKLSVIGPRYRDSDRAGTRGAAVRSQPGNSAR
jgi:hypothetical protein